MIEAKYGMKYSFPHTITHIIDNSAYTGTAVPVSYADDPSLFSTLVVGAFPMGEDGKVIRLDRTDIPRVCYGLNSITKSDREKLGQVVDYPVSLIKQGAPVQLLRVTPEDATYAYTIILVSYKWVDDPSNESIFHVKFTSTDIIPAGVVLSNFKNPERLAETIIKQYNNTPMSEDGWTTRAFAVAVSAGRGKVYNNMNLAITPVSQAKKPKTVLYTFSTIDSRNSAVVEEFVAALINTERDYVSTVNNVIKQRIPGGSILKPFINEKAVVEVFNEYKKCYQTMLDSGAYVNDSFVTNSIKSLTANTFDIVSGKFIYAGGLDIRLPFYQVDAEDSNIPRLSETFKVYNTKTEYDATPDLVLKNKMIDAAYGINHNGCSVYVGDVYFNATGSRYINPRLSVVCGINQYTQAVTSVTFDTVYPLVQASASSGTTVNVVNGYGVNVGDTSTNPAVPIKKVFDTLPTSAALTADTSIAAGDVIVVINGADTASDGFTLYTITGTSTKTAVAYTKEQVLSAIPYTRKIGMDNIINVYAGDDDAFATQRHAKTPGFVTIDITKGTVSVNNYDIADSTANVIAVNDNALKAGNTPTTAGTTADIVGQSYDVLTYNDDDVTKWKVSGATVTATTGTFNLGDVVKNTTGDDEIKFAVTGVDTTGKVTELSPLTNNSTVVTAKVTGSVTLTDVNDSAKKVTATVADSQNVVYAVKVTATPYEITRYIVTGTIGSLYKITADGVKIPDDYYSNNYGMNLDSTFGGVALVNGSAGFLDEEDLNPIVFKYKYAELLTRAFKGEIDPAILSPVRTQAKFLFDAGYNTVVGSSFTSPVGHTVADWINASVSFTDDEREEILYYPDTIGTLRSTDIDVKQAMYDLMLYRIYDGIPDDKRPMGPGSGFSVLFDGGITDGTNALIIDKSFSDRFTNPNASWDIGGMTTPDGITYTFVKRSVDNLFTHCKQYSINKPFTGDYTAIAPNEYVSIFPDVDASDWEYRELMWKSCGNAWLPDENGYIKRMSQRTFYSEETSDLIWESNMRTLSQLVYLLRQKIQSYLFEYSDDTVLKTMKNECDTLFANWVGNIVDVLELEFYRDTNTDGGDVVVCEVAVTFRGLVVRVPVIVNVNRRSS